MQKQPSSIQETYFCLLLIALGAFIVIASVPVLVDFVAYLYDTTTYEIAEWVNQPHTLY